eukprot:9105875-Pyramimonas_sp.AAC.1
MRADLRHWAALWFEDYTCPATNSGPWLEWCAAFVIAMFKQGGNNPLRQLLFRVFPGRTLQQIVDDICVSAWRRTAERRQAFIQRLRQAPHEER